MLKVMMASTRALVSASTLHQRDTAPMTHKLSGDCLVQRRPNNHGGIARGGVEDLGKQLLGSFVVLIPFVVESDQKTRVQADVHY
jgi:hypothetical protein